MDQLDTAHSHLEHILMEARQTLCKVHPDKVKQVQRLATAQARRALLLEAHLVPLKALSGQVKQVLILEDHLGQPDMVPELLLQEVRLTSIKAHSGKVKQVQQLEVHLVQHMVQPVPLLEVHLVLHKVNSGKAKVAQILEEHLGQPDMVRAFQLLEAHLTSIKEHSGKVKQVQHLEVPLDLHMGLLETAYINRVRLQLEDRLCKVHSDRAKLVHKGQLDLGHMI